MGCGYECCQNGLVQTCFNAAVQEYQLWGGCKLLQLDLRSKLRLKGVLQGSL